MTDHSSVRAYDSSHPLKHSCFSFKHPGYLVLLCCKETRENTKTLFLFLLFFWFLIPPAGDLIEAEAINIGYSNEVDPLNISDILSNNLSLFN